MPLVVICGIPCSGKTRHAQLLEKHFLESGKKVHLINEESLHIAKSDGYKGTGQPPLSKCYACKQSHCSALKFSVDPDMSPKIIFLRRT